MTPLMMHACYLFRFFFPYFMRAAAAVADDDCGLGICTASNTTSSCVECPGVVLLESHSHLATAPTRRRGLQQEDCRLCARELVSRSLALFFQSYRSPPCGKESDGVLSLSLPYLLHPELHCLNLN